MSQFGFLGAFTVGSLPLGFLGAYNAAQSYSVSSVGSGGPGPGSGSLSAVNRAFPLDTSRAFPIPVNQVRKFPVI